MTRKRTTVLAGTAALVAAAGVGAGGYAAVAAGDTTTTTVVQPSAAASSTAAAETTTVGEVYRRTYRGVVEITATSTRTADTPFPSGDQTQQAQGSGFVYDGEGHIVTNYHVVQGAGSIEVTFADGKTYGARLVGSDPSSDLAVLKVDAPSSELQPLALGDSSKVAVGDGVVAIGSPFGLEETVTAGIVSALNRTISSDTSYSIAGAIQTDAPINHGNSGGPLLNMDGQVIGVNSQIESDSGGNDGVGFAIASNTVRSVVSKLIGGERVEHAYLGVYVETPSNRSGARVARVVAGSPAADAGLKAGDVVTSFGGARITSPDDLTGAVAAKTPGTEVKVTYVRDGQTRTTTVTLGSRSS